MLARSRAHWHGQRSSLRTADQRNLVGVRATERRQVFAEMRWQHHNNSLDMFIFNASLRPANMRLTDVFPGLVPLHPQVLEGEGDEELLVINAVHALDPGYFRALMFQEPTLMVGSRTGARVNLSLIREGDTPRLYVVGDLDRLQPAGKIKHAS